jgi:spermidine/putrescine transport system permease protein
LRSITGGDAGHLRAPAQIRLLNGGRAFDLGASSFKVLATVTLPYLKPALIGSGLVSFLMSSENFNTVLMLEGPDPPLTITMFGRMKEGSRPLLDAVSQFMMLASALSGLVSILAQRDRGAKVH